MVGNIDLVFVPPVFHVLNAVFVLLRVVRFRVILLLKDADWAMAKELLVDNSINAKRSPILALG
jgi:hypothetical protein